MKKVKEPIQREKKAIESFVKEVLAKYKKEIKAIWLLKHANEFLLVLLVDDIKAGQEKIREIEIFALNLDEKIGKEYGVVLHTDILKVTSYYDALIENRIDVFLEIKKAICLYDPSGFFMPIKVLVEKGEIRGTKEAVFKLIMEVRKNMKELKHVKLEALSNIYTAVIDAAESALMARGISFFIPKEIPKLLDKEFFRKKLISKKTLEAFKEVYNAYKAYEHGEIEEINGKKLDELIKKADIFISEMQDLTSKAI